MVRYDKKELMALQTYLEEHGANLSIGSRNSNLKSFRPLIKSLMFRSDRNIDGLIEGFLEVDAESWCFLTLVPLRELPLLINHDRFALLSQWRISIGK